MKYICSILVAFSTSVYAQSISSDWLDKLTETLRDDKSLLISASANSNSGYSYLSASFDQLENCPSWDGTGDPPLTIGKAEQIARTFLSQEHGGMDDLHLIGMSLNSFSSEYQSNRWYYKFTYRDSSKTRKISSGQFKGIPLPNMPKHYSIHILLSGEILKEKRYQVDAEDAVKESE